MTSDLDVVMCDNGPDFDTIYVCAGSLKKKKRACPGDSGSGLFLYTTAKK